MGWKDPSTGRRQGANVTAQIWWSKNRFGWRDQQPLAKDDTERDGRAKTPEEVLREAKALIRILEGHGDTPPMIDATPKDEDEFKEFDA